MSCLKIESPSFHSQFSPDQPVRSETLGYVKKPSIKDKIHCVAFVVDATKILTYPKGLSTTFRQLREHICDLGENSTNNIHKDFFTRHTLITLCGPWVIQSCNVTWLLPNYIVWSSETFMTVFYSLSVCVLGVHQVALLTHIDKICSDTAKDVTQVYESRIIRDIVG